MSFSSLKENEGLHQMNCQALLESESLGLCSMLLPLPVHYCISGWIGCFFGPGLAGSRSACHSCVSWFLAGSGTWEALDHYWRALGRETSEGAFPLPAAFRSAWQRLHFVLGSGSHHSSSFLSSDPRPWVPMILPPPSVPPAKELPAIINRWLPHYFLVGFPAFPSPV